MTANDTITSSAAAKVGPIRVSENGRFFVDGRGQPFFWLGDTQWQLVRDFTLEEADTIIDDRKRKGFTVLQVMLTGVGNGTRPNLNGHTPWLNHDPSTPNEAYFEHVDAVLQRALMKGLIVVLGVFHQLHRAHITTENARKYARWVAQRYRDNPNIIWSMYPAARQEFIPVVRELAAGLQEESDHLITVHPDPSPASSSFIHDESWLACNMIQTWAHLKTIFPMVTEDYHREPIKPVVLAEGAYETPFDTKEYGFVITPLLMRRQAYWSYLLGAGHTYGHTDFWKWPADWRAALGAPGAFQMGVLKRILTSCDWWNLVPDASILTDQTDSDMPLNAAARSQSGDWVLVYLGDPTTVSVRMSSITGGNPVDASWINPQTGDSSSIGIMPNTGARSFATPDGWEDAVLLLKKRD